jgi:hypothetical protein
VLSSHQRKRKKKGGSLETALWMSMWGCSSPASYCQPSAAAGFDCLEFSWMHVPFVFSRIHPTHLLQLPSVFFLQFIWGVALPTLLWGFAHDSRCYKPSPFQSHWGKWHHSCLLQPACLFTVRLRECPSPTLQSLGCPTLFVMCPFFFNSAACLLFSLFFSLFSPWVGVSLSKGLCWSGLGLSVGVPLAA